MAKDDFIVGFDNTVGCTFAERAYEMYLAKMRQIDDLEFECEILVDKYHDEMKRVQIPMHLREGFLNDLFDKDKKKSGFARKVFLQQCFTEEFLKKHKVAFVTYQVHGYGRTAMGIVLDIGDYQYTVEIPLPSNIVNPKDKISLMGKVKFRVDRILKYKAEEFVRKMESVQMPTYDWKKCFEEIEAIVEKEGSKNG